MRKHPVRTAAIAIAAALTLTACSGSGGGNPAAGQSAADVQGIKDAEASFTAGFKAQDVEKVVAFYQSSASLFLPGQTPSKGTDVLRFVWRQALADPARALTLTNERTEVSAAGDLGYSQGTFDQTATDATSKKPVTVHGSYVTVFKKTANGSWKAIEDIVTPTRPATAKVAPAPVAPAPAGAVDPAAESTALKAREADWAAAFRARDAAKISSFFAPDATSMLPGGVVTNGAPAISTGMAEAVKDPAYKVELNTEATLVADSGDLGYTRGSFKVTATDPATKKPVEQTGYYVHVWRRQADGSWKAVQEIATPGIVVPAK